MTLLVKGGKLRAGVQHFDRQHGIGGASNRHFSLQGWYAPIAVLAYYRLLSTSRLGQHPAPYNIGKALAVRPLAESLPCIALSKSAELVGTGS